MPNPRVTAGLVLGLVGLLITSCKDDDSATDKSAVETYIASKRPPADASSDKPAPTPAPAESDAQATGDAQPSETRPAPSPAPTGAWAQKVTITVEGGEGLPDLDDGPGVTDAYVILEYDGDRHKTSVSSDENPTWGDSFAFQYRREATLRVTVMDQDVVSDEKVGVTTIPLPRMRSGEQKMLDVPFGGGNNGKVRLKLVGL